MERPNEFVGIVNHIEYSTDDLRDNHGFISVAFEYNDCAKSEMAVYGDIPDGTEIGSKVWAKGEISFGMGRYDDDEIYFDFYADEIKLLEE